ncbi:hypothetical protein JOC75_004420 [Metabacillus crassostreae]|nr:hypothetical protein [Metabacillus crassostreae]
MVFNCLSLNMKYMVIEFNRSEAMVNKYEGE